MVTPPAIAIDPFSVTSVYLKLYVNDNQLSTATGIIAEHNGKYYLITNWHVLSGRNPIDDQPLSPTGGMPEEVRIAHHINSGLGHWRFHGEPLIDESGAPRWIEHPNGRALNSCSAAPNSRG